MNPSPFSYQIYPLGDSSLTIDFGNRIDAQWNRQVMNLFHAWTHHPITGMKELIPAYSSLTVLYDPLSIRKAAGQLTAFEWMKQQIEKALSTTLPDTPVSTVSHRIPVCYDSQLAPELITLAACLQLSVEELIHLHTAPTYWIYMLGFLPGFPYMGEVDPRIALPRKASPAMVKAGSVGIAGQQTGIYPMDSPGGWCIIGQTPLTLFYPEKSVPVWLQPGHQVQFYPISLSEFETIRKEQAVKSAI